MAWTEGQQLELLGFVEQKLSASIIGEKMGKTRNAIIGRCHRTGLRLVSVARHKTNYGPYKLRIKSARISQALKRRPERHLSPVQELFYTEAVNLPPDFSDDMVSFADVKQDQCRWPIGEPASPAFRFCGSESMAHESYCPRHCRLAYRKSNPRPINAVPSYSKKMSAWEMRA